MTPGLSPGFPIRSLDGLGEAMTELGKREIPTLTKEMGAESSLYWSEKADSTGNSLYRIPSFVAWAYAEHGDSMAMVMSMGKGKGQLPAVEAGEFSIANWSGYPAGVPKPTGPFRLLEGAEYNAARNSANAANKALRKDMALGGQKVDVHEIQPVKFNGSPTNTANKAILDRSLHRQQVTPWWKAVQRAIESVVP